MDQRDNGQSTKSKSLIECIHEIAKQDARADINKSDGQLLLFLKSWWSRTYNRPLKDPLLDSYTIEELAYEFFDKIERKKAEQENIKAQDDKIEDEKHKRNLDWAEQEELKELEELRRQEEQSKINNDEKWMEKIVEQELKDGKEVFGQNYGEDIEDTFDG